LRGLTLIEVMVAVAIMGIGIVMVMQLFSGGLRAGGLSRDYTEALMHARDQMESLFIERDAGTAIDPGGSATGIVEKYRWRAEVTPHGESADPLGSAEGTGLQLLQIKVKVSWPEAGRERTVELVSLKARPGGGR
jgi:general secretion pathway protein I